MSLLAGILCDARAKLNIRLAVQGVYVVALAAALVAVAGGPLWSYGAVLAVGEILRNLAYNAIVIRRVIPVKFRELAKTYIPAISATALVILAVTAARAVAVYAFGAPLIVALAIEGSIAGLVYFVLVRWGTLAFLRHEVLSRTRVDLATRSSRLFRVALRILFGHPSSTLI
jgi:hypothetical protein